MLRLLVVRIGTAVVAAAGLVQLAMAQAAGGYPQTSPDAAQPAAYYSPQYAMAQPFAYSRTPQYSVAQRPVYSTAGNTYTPSGGYVPNGAASGNYGAVPRSAGIGANSAPTAVSPVAGNVPGGNGGYVSTGPMDGTAGPDNCPCDGTGGCWRHGYNWADMPQHYPYYPPMHGYYYFRPYHYTHVPTQQGFATQFGVDPRNPYSNDFFKVVYAEYRASLIRTSPEQVGTPSGAAQGPIEMPADTIKKLKALRDDGILTQEEFDSKKEELLGRM